jgi:hypothetical protein
MQNEKYGLSGRDVMNLHSLHLTIPSPLRMEDTSSPDEDESVESVNDEPPSGEVRNL